MKKSLQIFLALAMAAFLSTNAKASLVTFDWVPDPNSETDGNAGDNPTLASGTLVLDEGGPTLQIVTLDFSDGNGDSTMDTSPLANPQILADGNLVYEGTSTTYYPNYQSWGWAQNDATGTADEERVSFTAGQPDPVFVGDWVAVPEPSTFVAGASVLFPMGLSAVRAWRRKGVNS